MDYTVQTLELKLKVSEFGQLCICSCNYTVQTLELKAQSAEFGQLETFKNILLIL